MGAVFGTPEWHEARKAELQSLPVLWVASRPRKDGKFAVTYAFTTRSIRAILTPEKLAAEQASGQFQIRTTYR
jgi:hypothetical protein